MPAMTSATDSTAAFCMWTYIHGNRGLRYAAAGSTSVTMGWPFCMTTSYPRGVCSQELAISIQTADSQLPTPTASADSMYTALPTRSRPNTKMPRNVASSMNAIIPSTASGPPNSSPAAVENTAKLVPNSNSRTMPVTVPTTKLTANIFVQNRRNCSYIG